MDKVVQRVLLLRVISALYVSKFKNADQEFYLAETQSC